MSGPRKAARLVLVALAGAVVVGACDREDLTVATFASTSLPPDGGDDSGVSTCFDDEDCPSDAYCDKPGCSAGGTCHFPSCSDGDDGGAGTENVGTRQPQCGCNGVTYWNSCERESDGESLRYAGPCADDRFIRSCRSSADCPTLNFPHSASCALSFAGGHACDDDAMGTCWLVPYDCLGVTSDDDPPFYLPCGSHDFHCVSQCSAIFSGTPVTFAEDSCR